MIRKIIWLAAGLLGAALVSFSANANGTDDRTYTVQVLTRVAEPVLTALAEGRLKIDLPAHTWEHDRTNYAGLEALGRTLAGIAPWLELGPDDTAEGRLRARFIELSVKAVANGTDPKSPDFLNFTNGGQPLVDAAFLAQGILRAPKVLWEPLEPRVKKQIVAALKSSREIPTPDRNNWVMFAAMVEAALLEFGEPTVEERLENCVRKMLGWYVGDGAYGDGDFFHFDYYNSFVIQPMLVDVLKTLANHDAKFAPAHATVMKRAKRYAEIQERLIAPDGTFPSLGRSMTYRFGAFQTLAQMTLLRELPEHLKPAQVRCALTAVIRRIMAATGTFDARDWLQIGFCGHQPSLGENYISTGSLYLCAAGLLPLGLPPADEFWSAPATRWTSQKLWSGESLPADHALGDVAEVDVPTLSR